MLEKLKIREELYSSIDKENFIFCQEKRTLLKI